jgi:hypothetical protein
MVRRRQVLVVLVGAAAVWSAGPLAVPAGAARAAGSWGRAIEVPGLGALNKSGVAGVSSVSCTSAGNCSAGGFYRDQHRHEQGFVAVERYGRWNRAIEVPGLGALNKGGQAQVVSVSCSSAGNCAAGGKYRGRSGHTRGFVVSEKNGVWGQAIEMLGLRAMGSGGNAGVSQVSCATAGDCAAVGNYTDGLGHQQGFVASEKNGVWGQAIEVPGLGALNTGGNASVWSVSCATAGDCAAVGDYTDGSGNGQGFVASEKKGLWGQAIEVPGLGALNTGGSAAVGSVSCGTAGDCAAGGGYTDSSGYEQGFVVDEKKGVWGQATEVPGLGAKNDGTDAPQAFVGSVSCTAPGDCMAGGDVGGPYSWAWVASEKNGVWGQATYVPGLQALVSGRWASLGSVSCVSPGNCAVGGDYENAGPGGIYSEAFVASQRNGRWDNATKVPGLGALNKVGGDDVTSVSCGSLGHCTAGGYYGANYGHRPVQGFVT